MNFFTIISLIMAIAVFIGGLFLSSSDLSLFFDTTSLFIVFGGSFAATAISFKLNKVFKLFVIFLKRLLKGSTIDNSRVVIELISATNEMKKGKTAKDIAEKTEDHFIKEAFALIHDGLVEADELIEVLEMRNRMQARNYKVETDKVKAIGKYPPAFGMIGTTIGMIVLLANLGAEDAMKLIGPAMGVCLITTLYGAAMANIFLLPMADNLNDSARELYAKNEIIIESVKLILAKKSPILVAERLNSFLNPSDRVDWREIIK